MKKIILILLLLLIDVTCIAQNSQFRVIYSKTAFKEDKKETIYKESTNVFFFNYEEENKIKIYKSDNSVEILIAISDIEHGQTTGGHKYSGAVYIGDDADELYIQIFEDPKYGTRMIFASGITIQFFQ